MSSAAFPARPSALRGAKGPSAPYEASDTLRSTQVAEIVDLLGEGPIGGLVNGLKSIYLDGVPVENADGSRNFQEFGYQLTLGGPTSEAEHAFADAQTEVGVGVTVLAAVPVVRTISDATADAVRVTITVPQLSEQKANGDRVGSAFEFAVDIQSNGGGYVERHRETIAGKASAAYSRAMRLSLAEVGPAPWDVRVRRISADSASPSIVNAFAWASYTVISGVRMLYRHSAVARLVFDARNFSAVPQRWYDVWGVADWDIPVNYDPLARTVSGSWNGVFKQGPTNNPAWVLYNLIKHPRYGLGAYAVQLPDKWTLYQLQQWCDEQLPDGRGGTEPRYAINEVIVEQREALQLLQEICSVFRGVLMHAGDTLTVSWDAPGTPVASYTPANVVDGMFTYADGSGGDRKTSCTCWYTDRSQAGKRVPVTWDDPDMVAAYGLRPMEIRPLGVATPGQALRMAKWALFTSHLEAQTISFRVGAEGPLRRLGEVFQVADPTEAGERLGGRIQSATTTQVTLDAPVALSAGETYTLWVTQPHPSDDTRLVLESRIVTNGAGSTSVLNVSPAMTAAPLVATIWLLEGSDVAPTLWRYVAMNEVAAEGGKPEYEVMGVRHEPGKWALIEADQPLSTRPTRRLPFGAPPVASIDITETNYTDGSIERIRVSVSWPLPAAGLRYLVTWRLESGPWTTLPATSANTVDVDGLQPGLFEVQVQSTNALAQLSAPVSATLALTGADSLPPDVTGFAATVVDAGIQVSWGRWSAAIAGDTELRHGVDWASGAMLFRGRSTTYTAVAPPPGTYELWAKHYTLDGQRESAAAAHYQVIWNGISLLASMALQSTGIAFIFDNSAATSSASPTITLTAQLSNLSGTASFVATAYTAAGTSLGTVALGGSGNVRTLAAAQFNSLGATTTRYVRVVATLGSHTDEVTIFRGDGGSSTLTMIFGNEFAAVPTLADGSGGVFSNAHTQYVRMYEGTTDVTHLWTWSRADTSCTSLINGVAGPVAGQSDVNVTVSAMSADTAYVTITATRSGYTTQARQFRLARAKQGNPGAAGANQLIVYAYRRAAGGAPAQPSATATYTFSTKSLTGLNNSWTPTVPAGTDPLYVIAATASSSTDTDTIAAAEWSSAQQLSGNDGAAGADGLNTATVSLYQRSASATALALPNGSLTYNFATGLLSGSAFNGWSQTIPSSGGSFLHVTLATAISATTTDTILSSEWSADRVLSQDGGSGAQGNSIRVAYALYSGNPTITGSQVVTSGGSSFPTTTAWSPTAVTAWSTNRQTPSTGQSELMTQGTFDGTNTTWQPPFLANFKVGNLAALSADLGTVTAGNLNTSGYVLANGGSGVTLLDPSLLLNQSRTCALVGNLSAGAQVGVVGFTTDATAPGVYAYSSNTGSNGVGLFAYGCNGLIAYGLTGTAGSAVVGQASGHVSGRAASFYGASGVGTTPVAVFISDVERGSTGPYPNAGTCLELSGSIGRALKATGPCDITGLLSLVAPAGKAQMRLTPLAGRPADRTVGSLAMIYTAGGSVDARTSVPMLFIGDGTNWLYANTTTVYAG